MTDGARRRRAVVEGDISLSHDQETASAVLHRHHAIPFRVVAIHKNDTQPCCSHVSTKSMHMCAEECYYTLLWSRSRISQNNISNHPEPRVACCTDSPPCMISSHAPYTGFIASSTLLQKEHSLANVLEQPVPACPIRDGQERPRLTSTQDQPDPALLERQALHFAERHIPYDSHLAQLHKKEALVRKKGDCIVAGNVEVCDVGFVAILAGSEVLEP